MSARKIKFYRYLAFFMALNILAEVVSPTLALALTNGPSQTEFESFEPADTNQMVDLFSGDFNYNIPLMTVPGPNGGYPINLAYHAGIGMEQEAGWVGLGWNINAGEINRNMRGLPDDFNGDQVTKVLSKKPNITGGVDMDVLAAISGTSYEYFGLDQTSKSFRVGLYWNNYKGIGISSSFSYFPKNENIIRTGISGGYDSQSGISLSPSISYGNNLSASAHATINSRQGVLSYGVTLSGKKNINVETDYMSTNGSTGFLSKGFNYGTSAYIPSNETSYSGTNLYIDFKYGLETVGDFTNIPFEAKITTEGVDNPVSRFSAYGYNYMQNRGGSTEKYEMSDFNRSSNHPITEDAPALPVPAITNDLYYAKAQGMGGGFRAYRNDHGILYDPSIVSATSGSKMNVEAGGGTYAHIGANVDYVNTSDNYSGKWQEDFDAVDDFNFKNGDDALHYKFMGETVTDDGVIDNVNGDMTPRKFQLAPSVLAHSHDLPSTGFLFIPKIVNEDDNGTKIFNNPQRSSRRKRVNTIETRSYNQIAKSQKTAGVYPGIAKNIYNNTGIPGQWQTYAANLSAYDFGNAANKPHHQAEVSVLNSSGYRYVYGLPAYNKNQEDVTFNSSGAIASTGFSGTTNNSAAQSYNRERTTDYADSDAGPGNDEGRDNFFYSTQLPPYAHSYLLTAIYSADYVDLTNNGPSEDDFGYYTKFNYEKKYDDYKWRTPYVEAHLSKGHYSDLHDDKASYSYGTKEIWYLSSVETKTHVAIFKLNSTLRSDAREPKNKDNHAQTADLANTRSLCSLESISLYNKNDLNRAIKTTHFDYDYSLCKGLPNNVNSYPLNNPTDYSRSGKLTLKKVWFTFLGNSKGSMSPYKFDYGQADNDQNPAYSMNNTDRWGNYKKTAQCANSGLTCSSEDYSYVDQSEDYNKDGTVTAADEDLRNKHTSAWSLKKITLPSGGKINIEYEQDDYAYVQDKAATEMFEILFTGPSNDPSPDVTSERISENYSRLYFKLRNDPITGLPDENMGHYIPPVAADGKSHIYFKTYTELKNTLDFKYKARDYVSGYFDIVAHGTELVNGVKYGYVKVAAMRVSNTSFGKCHPISKAAWQYMRLERPDLLYPDRSIGAGNNLLQTFITIFKDLEMLLGYYDFCSTNGYAQKLELNAEKPSFVRLLNPNGHKKGGGYRVKRISYSNNWHDMSTDTNNNDDTYGQEYSYLLADGRSSGVAAYEPIFGGEENPFRKPSRTYSSVNGPLILRNSDLYMEEPYGENYFPAPQVGYSRVLVKSLTQPLNAQGNEISSKTKPGISVTEFFTAKDFPVQVNQTNIKSMVEKPQPLAIPLIGSVAYESHGYSQGYSILLNDMHGKLHSVSTYSPADEVPTKLGCNVSATATARAQTEYEYFTSSPYSAAQKNELNNNITVLDKDGVFRTALVGQTGEDFVDMEEHSSKSYIKDMEGNIDIIPLLGPLPVPPIPIPTLWPSFFRSADMLRTVVYNHVITQNGILKEVRTKVDGSTSKATNLMFDADSGTPLLTSVTNDFDKPVYSYTYPAHWAYKGMNGAWQNQGWEYTLGNGVAISTGILSPVPASVSKLCEGDMLEVYLSNGNIDQCWVTAISINGSDNTKVDITLRNEAGTAYAPPAGQSAASIRVLRSGYKNHQGASMGQIVALVNPVTGCNSPMLAALNAGITPVLNPASGKYEFTLNYNKCNGTAASMACTISGTSISFTDASIPASPFDCHRTGVMQLPFTIVPADFSSYRFYYLNSSTVLVENSVSHQTWQAVWAFDAGKYCMVPEPPCGLDGVLHADATHYSDTWDFNYADIGDPVTNNGTKVALVAAGNTYRFGIKGIWRPLNTWAYQSERKQTATQTHNYEDGTYKDFTPHNWLAGNERLYSPLNPSFSTSASVTGNPKWTFIAENTQYNPYGFVTEKVDALGKNSSALYGYNNSVQTAVAANAAYYEIAYDGFEDHGAQYSIAGHGHLKLGVAATPLSATESHTGTYSYPLAAGGVNFNVPAYTNNYYSNNAAHSYFTPQLSTPSPAKTYRYLVSAWFKRGTGNTSGVPQISIGGAINPKLSLGPIIDQWQKVDYEFDTPLVPVAFNLNFGFNNGGNGFLDDVRIQPFTSAITTYVYNPQTLWNVAELDNRNFATFYNYDEEGMLVQVKKETERGIVTIKSARSNVRRNPNP